MPLYRARVASRATALGRPGPGRWAGLSWTLELPRLAVHGVPTVARAELPQLDAVGVVAAVLGRDVVALLALHTRQCDLGTYFGRLSHGGVPSSLLGWSCSTFQNSRATGMTQ